jgi:Glycosyl transferase family 11
MIGIQLKGRLGNQMFQYAAARTLAEQIGCALLLAGNTLGRRYGIAGHWLRLDEAPALRGIQQNGVLRAAFVRGPRFWQGRAVELALPWLKGTLFSRTFSPRRRAVAASQSFEEFDETIFSQKSGTWLSGWFQSENYFTANAERVRRWFEPSRRCSQRADELLGQWPNSPENMAAIHIRRGDYANIEDGLGQADQGWLLPMSYYREALDRIPGDVPLALFSDDPDWAAHEFAGRHPWISRDNSAVLDMFLIARCRWNIIANSSFSWWAAWLNTQTDKVVIAPKYHLGWRLGSWLPGGIAVPGWQYLDVGV